MGKDTITGVIYTDKDPIMFYSEAKTFEFCFMNNSIYSFLGNNDTIEITTKEGFICGKTHGNHDIAIYLGDSQYEILNKGILNTSAYIISTSNMMNSNIMEYDAIQFVGGTLNDVFHINGMDIDVEDGKTVLKYVDDSITHNIIMPELCIEMDIHSSISEHRSLRGNHIDNKEAILTLKFDKSQSIKTFFEHYNKVLELLSFMTFRENVGFEKIFLLKNNNEINYPSNLAEVFIRYDYTLEPKDIYRNISFHDLGDTLPSLLALFYNTEDKKQTISLGFIPKDNRDVNIMDNTKIRAICSALECELSFIKDIKPEENKELNELVEIARHTVKAFRKNHKKISNDTYNLVFSNIDYWSFTLSEKLCALYKKYENEMAILNKTRIHVTEKLINDFVKYRNDITHGKYRMPEMGIAVAAHFMCGLVYCCILDRIGINREKIQDLCENQILS